MKSPGSRTDDLAAGSAGGRAGHPRRPWAAPRVTFRQPLEAVAALCGPPNGKQPGLCVISQS